MTESFVGKIIADGRLTIPENIRKVLMLKENDLVRVTVERVNKDG